MRPAAEPFLCAASTAALLQLLSEATRGTAVSSGPASTEEVRMKRFSEFPCLNAEFRIDAVPRTAGMMSSVYAVLSAK